MGTTSIMCGYIATPAWMYEQYPVTLSQLVRHNRKIVNSLPRSIEQDDDPYLLQSLFSSSPTCFAHEHVFHFGASYISPMFCDWVILVYKCEALLRRMYWHEAEMRINGVTLNSRCAWRARPSKAAPYPLPTVDWDTIDNPVIQLRQMYQEVNGNIECLFRRVEVPPFARAAIKRICGHREENTSPDGRRW